MMMRRLPLLLGACILAAALGAQRLPGRRGRGLLPPSPVPPVFVKAVNAMDHLRYGGERIVEGRQGALRKTHNEYVLQDGVNSRVWYPAGSQFSGQVIVETATERLHYYPGRNQIEVLPARKEQAYARLRQWIEHPGRAMRLSSAPGERIAGHSTEIGVVSDPRGNVRQRLWIDPATGMVLRREMYDNVGDRTLYFEFIQIDYNPIIRPEDFKINVPSASRITLLDKLRNLCRRSKMLYVSLPGSTGFTLEGVNMRQLAGLAVLHEVYTGPSGPLSLFQVGSNIDAQNLRPPEARDLQLYGWQIGGNSFAFVGNYPVSRLKELSQLLASR